MYLGFRIVKKKNNFFFSLRIPSYYAFFLSFFFDNVQIQGFSKKKGSNFLHYMQRTFLTYTE
ncbi:uncharacterized protein BX663DRAFT_499668 [Cokeromyces recurvatus]|uniref:uncharacterized protein n=1 Tax=Cokeromyces recurvatus TaxID=90255 RepID=UPI00221E8654|nr:uncharacterized protein BX663DRAFT_499668 [Cokeromyces recurvatus]KAI7905422.1 hypothetical protein BX663DRAFT_499668 [Cokeromyces recurvatus]